MATYNELATGYASKAKSDYEKSLSYLTTNAADQEALAEQSLEEKYKNLLDQINRQTTGVNTTYDNSVKQAYIDKMLSGKKLDTTLSQMGLDTQGFGVNQQMLNENAFGQAKSSALDTKSTALTAIGNQATDTQSQYNQALLSQKSDYASRLSDLQKYIGEQGMDVYNQQYANYINDLQYQDQLRQREFEKQLAQQQQQLAEQQFTQQKLATSTPYVKTAYYDGNMTQDQVAAINAYGTFNTTSTNGVKYQPAGVVYNGAAYGKLSKYADKAGYYLGSKATNSSGEPVAEQKLWKTADGTFWIWNGSKMTYEPQQLQNSTAFTKKK